MPWPVPWSIPPVCQQRGGGWRNYPPGLLGWAVGRCRLLVCRPVWFEGRGVAKDHPAYRTKNYKAFRKNLKNAAAEGRPVPCFIAGPKCKKVALIPHHIVPLSKGGSWAVENLAPVCSWCNNWQARLSPRRKTFS